VTTIATASAVSTSDSRSRRRSATQSRPKHHGNQATPTSNSYQPSHSNSASPPDRTKSSPAHSRKTPRTPKTWARNHWPKPATSSDRKSDTFMPLTPPHSSTGMVATGFQKWLTGSPAWGKPVSMYGFHRGISP
jgi:hypothetical protein